MQQRGGPGFDPLEVLGIGLVVGVAGAAIVDAEPIRRRRHHQVDTHVSDRLEQPRAVAAQDAGEAVVVDSLGHITCLRPVGAGVERARDDGSQTVQASGIRFGLGKQRSDCRSASNHRGIKGELQGHNGAPPPPSSRHAGRALAVPRERAALIRSRVHAR